MTRMLHPGRYTLRGSVRLVAGFLLLTSLILRPASAINARSGGSEFVDRVIASLTPEERVGQLVMVNFVGDDVSAQSDVAALIRDFKVGAVIVQASNGNVINRDDTARQVAGLTNGLQQRAYETSHRIDATTGEYFLPVLIATDNEGDLFPFTNVTHNYTSIPNNMTIGATWQKEQAESVGRTVGSELGGAGINMLLGPVVDVLSSPRSGGNGDIGVRSFGGNPAWAGELGRAYVRGIHEGSAGKMLTVVKHFPGHGGSDRSTDNEVPTVNKSLDQLRASDLLPFGEAGREDAGDPLATTDAMMVSHIRYRSFAGGGAQFTRPISIDGEAFRTLMDLSEFSAWRPSHLVMADALGVPAVKKWYAEQEGQPDFPNRGVVKDALLAGSDLLPLVEFYRDPDKRGWKDYQLPVIQDSILYMREQYASNPDFRRRADDAVRHVIEAKLKLYPQLMRTQVTVDPAAAAAAAGGSRSEMESLAADALTLLQPQSVSALRSRLPRGPVTPDKVLIIECWEDCYPYRVMAKNELQDQLLALYGPAGAGRLQPADVNTVSFGELDAWLTSPKDPAQAVTAKAVADASWIVLALTEYNPVGRPVSAAAKRFLDSPPVDLRNKNVVAIAYNVPYHLDSTEISKVAAYFAVYNKTDAAIQTGWKALFGDATPKGHPPVSVSGVFYDVADAVLPAESQQVALSVYGHAADDVPDGKQIALVAGPVVDHNGNPIPDGANATFSLTQQGAAPLSTSTRTVDGIAIATLSLSGAGSYAANASIDGVAANQLSITVRVAASPAATAVAGTNTTDQGGGSDVPAVPLFAGIAGAGALAAAAGVVLYRRRRTASRALAGASAQPRLDVAPAPRAPVEPARLHVDADTRRVYIKGIEVRPALSSEQFKLLSYLYQRAGKVVARDELVQNVWPDAHAEGVSEEALDALVRRVRERLVQGGGERSYLVTLRGQGFRLDI
jgi:beta-N-acetylhexosaminidase